MTQEFNVGSRARLFGEFRNYAGTLADPSTVTAKVRAPDGTVTTYSYASAEITKVATGQYYIEHTFTSAGKWYYRFAGTGDVTAADEDPITVQATVF